MIAKAFKIIGVNILILLVILLMLEGALQIYALIRPSYDVIFLHPDKVVGWKQFPNLHWTWAGRHWYASDFSVNVETNSLGFRDIEREFTKPHDVKRVALLGDSFIEAVQVPFEKTAGQLLQQSLNTLSGHDLEHSWKWEVLNFGISNYGVGQYLLVWEQYARNYDPDYVAIFVSNLQMFRTLERHELGGFGASRKNMLWIRPTFRLENDKLILEPAEDYDEFVKAQEDLLNTEFAGQRSRRKKQLITVYYAKQFMYELRAKLARRFVQNPKQIKAPHIIYTDNKDYSLAINLKIIEELGVKVAGAGGRLVVLDASGYLEEKKNISGPLMESCSKNGFGYIPLYSDLLKANADGISTWWPPDGHFNDAPRDGHFNDAGNEILAKALFDWIKQNESR